MIRAYFEEGEKRKDCIRIDAVGLWTETADYGT